MEEVCQKKKKEFGCPVCKKRFSWQRSMKEHMETIHNQPQERKKRVECPLCLYMVSTRRDLFKHLTNSHNINIELETHNFQNVDDFITWKKNEERSTLSQFVLGRGTSILKDSSKKVYYQCSRSGTNNYSKMIKPSNIKTRKSKSGGSVKMGKFCPASMEVHYTKDGVFVSFWKTHLGHGENTLSEIDQNIFADEVAIEVTVENESLHNDEDFFVNSSSNGGIDNIKILNEFEENNDEAMSVWISSMDGLKEHTPVLYYKESNSECNEQLRKEDMCLVLMTNFQKHICEQLGKKNICIDSIICENTYDFDLTTLSIVDEFGDGCPVAYCISNKVDETVLKIFFKTIKDKIGSIVPSVLMCNKEYYKIWTSVMSSPKNHLFCSWYVLEDWKTNLSKVTKKEKGIVYDKLKSLMDEPSIEEFDNVLDNFTSHLLNNVKTAEFGRYFQLNYAFSYTQWALCFRTEFGIETNEPLEKFRENLKHIFEESKKFTFTKTLQTLCDLTNDKIFDRLVKISVNQPITKTMRIKNNHRKSLKVSTSRITLSGSNRWEISNSKTGTCTVELLSNLKCTNTCIYKCDLCQVCLHMFTCTCFDFIVRCNMCIHIHACATKMKSAEYDNSNTGISEMERKENLKLSIRNQLKQLNNICENNDMSEEAMKKIILKIDQAINIGNEFPQKINCEKNPKSIEQLDKEHSNDAESMERNMSKESFASDSEENNEFIVTEENIQDFDHSYAFY